MKRTTDYFILQFSKYFVAHILSTDCNYFDQKKKATGNDAAENF